MSGAAPFIVSLKSHMSGMEREEVFVEESYALFSSLYSCLSDQIKGGF